MNAPPPTVGRSITTQDHAAVKYLQKTSKDVPGCKDYFFLSLPCFRLAHRARTAWRAISRLRSGLRFAARIIPPFTPPSFPRATALGFFGFFSFFGVFPA